MSEDEDAPVQTEGSLSAQVAELIERLDDAEKAITKLVAESTHKTVYWWPHLTKKEAKALWAEVTKFVDEVIIGRYEKSDIIFPCWFMHERVLDVLTALYAAWDGNYDKKVAKWSPAEWQKNWRDPLLEDAAQSLTSCVEGCRYIDLADVDEDDPDLFKFRSRTIEADIEARPDNHEDKESGKSASEEEVTEAGQDQ